jgi:ParB family chromosome partitioning protein
MVDSNLQREKILPSEKAYSYKMKLDAIKRKAGRPKNNLTPVVSENEKLRTNEQLGQEVGESREQIRRYICLTELIPEILQIVDTGKIAFRPAVEISSLPRQKQKSLYDTMEMDDCTPSLTQAMKLKKFEQDGNLTDEVILSIMSEEKPNQVPQFKMPHERISRFFPTEATKAQIEDTIVKALELYRKRERERNAGMER